MKKVLSSLTGLAIAAPLSIGIAFAEDTNEAMPMTVTMTQACLTARTGADDALIAAKTAQTASEISAIQAHKSGIVAAFALTDEAAKKAAFKKAETDVRSAMKASMDAFRASMKISIEAVKTACGKSPAGDMRTMEGREDAKKGFMNKMMKAFGRGKIRGNRGNSSSSIAQ